MGPFVRFVELGGVMKVGSVVGVKNEPASGGNADVGCGPAPGLLVSGRVMSVGILSLPTGLLVDEQLERGEGEPAIADWARSWSPFSQPTGWVPVRRDPLPARRRRSTMRPEKSLVAAGSDAVRA
jgi:hypothetical protein